MQVVAAYAVDSPCTQQASLITHCLITDEGRNNPQIDIVLVTCTINKDVEAGSLVLERLGSRNLFSAVGLDSLASCSVEFRLISLVCL
jgi:hypothetical protein